MSGTEINDEQLLNIKLIFSTLSVFQLDISGIEVNDEQLQNKD